MTILTDTEATELTQHNLEVWDRCAPSYVGGFEALTSGATESLLDLAEVGNGTSLLDIGTGPGTIIGPAKQRGAEVTAVDLSPAMVALAKKRYPTTDISLGDASSLEYKEATFDAITIGFCLHHAANPNAMLAEALRVLRPGGRLSFAVWAPAEQLEAFGLAFATIGAVVPLDQFPNLQAPVLGEVTSDYEELLSNNGFTNTTARALELSWAVKDGSAIFAGFDQFLDLSDQDSATRGSVRDALDKEVAKRTGSDGFAHLANPAIIAAASKS